MTLSEISQLSFAAAPLYLADIAGHLFDFVKGQLNRRHISIGLTF